MKRITFWILSTVSAVVLLFGFDASTATTPGASPPAIVSGTTGTASSTSSSSPAGTSTTVTGSVSSTRWGPVQVELTVSDGTITQVDVLQRPSGNPKDEEINDYALPILTLETTDAQGASIDMVSGATVTSAGYLQSLKSALDLANL